MRLIENDNDYKEIVILAAIGDYIVEKLPKGEGYIFSKEALQLCREWIEGNEIELSDFYECLDSSEEIDFMYYEDMAENKEQSIIYRNLFNIVAYTTKKISILRKVNRPQYLDYICDDYFETFVNQLIEEDENIGELIKNL